MVTAKHRGSVPFDQYHALVLELLAMKRDGFVVPSQWPAPPPQPTLPGAVLRAVATITIGNPQLERTLLDTAWGLLRQGHPEPDVAQMILDGEPLAL